MTQFHDTSIVIATRNQGKINEFVELFRKLNIEVQSLNDFNDVPEIVEDGDTFAANAEKKARIIAHHLQKSVLADDSGLCVDALNGQPGVYSARYAGEHASDEMNNRKLLEELALQRHPQVNDEDELLSSAHYVCSLVLYDPKKETMIQVEGTCSGHITAKPRGENGFGYDPLFYVEQYGKTMAELSPEIKNQISHRAKALEKLFAKLSRG